MVVLAVCIGLVIVLPLIVLACVVARSRAADSTRPVSPALPPMAPQWAPDPTGRHEFRYWNGTKWTADVSDRGVLSADP